MSDPAPAYFLWDAERSVMAPHRKNHADRTYVDRAEYRLGVVEERSANSHSHYFAALHETWMNLPDDLSERFPSTEHLRKYALIKAGFRDERTIACSSKAEAQRVASFVKPMDGYALVAVKDAVVVVYTAKSQSFRAMGKDDFQKSKEAVLEIIAGMIGVTAKQLEGAST